MTEISIKTGTVKDAESDGGAELEICDVEGVCCKTTKLNNVPGDDRESGQTDVYTQQTILGDCAKEVNCVHITTSFILLSREVSLVTLKQPN